MANNSSRLRLSNALSEWLSQNLAYPSDVKLRRDYLFIICLIIFLLGLGVRLLHWQDRALDIHQQEETMPNLAKHYKQEARQMLDEGYILYPASPVDPGDARPILHPPGYSYLMAVVSRLTGAIDAPVRLAQIIGDSLAALLVLFIATALFRLAIATLAGLLVAVSPHFAHYSLWLSPDTLPVLPILIAGLLVVKTSQRPRLWMVLLAGAMIGLSCWLRANGLLLAPFFAVAVFFTVERSKRWVYPVALVGATLLVISPITIRNWILYHHFIPVSIAGGENLVVGIGDLDPERRFGMPASDGEAAAKDAEWHNRPDYGVSLWSPDGIERDQYRYQRGLEVIRANPGWFLGAMVKRAMFMLRYNDSISSAWPFNTANVPVISPEPSVAGAPAGFEEQTPVWSVTGSQLLAAGEPLAKTAEVSTDGETFTLRGDASAFGEQFQVASIAVARHTDYAVTLTGHVAQGAMGIKITDANRRITLDSLIFADDEKPKPDPAAENGTAANPNLTRTLFFSSGNRSEVRLVISNDRANQARPEIRLAEVKLFNLGQTPYLWTRYPRLLIRGLQKNIYQTKILLPLVLLGLGLLLWAGRGRVLILLLAVPAYYLLIHSALSTEYRYILAIHYFFFILAAVALFCAGLAIKQGTAYLFNKKAQ